MNKLQLWFLKTFFPRVYYRKIWTTPLRRMSKSLQGAAVSMRDLAKALEEYNKEVNRHDAGQAD